VRPAWVLIAAALDDDSTLGAVREYGLREDAIPTVYVESSELGASHQRNAALDRLPPGTTHILFMDDDCVALPDYVECLLKTMLEVSWSSPAGVAGVSTPSTTPKETWHDFLWRAFGLATPRDAGRLLSSGINVAPPHDGPPIRAGWLFGCALFAVESVRDIRFCESFGAYALCDDVDYSACASGRGALWVDPTAKLEHLQSDIGRPPMVVLVRKSVHNRWQLVCRHPDILSRRAFWLSVLGTLIRDSGSIAKRRDRASVARLGGRVAGIADTVRAMRRPWPLRERPSSVPSVHGSPRRHSGVSEV